MPTNNAQPPADPGYAQVRRYLTYWLSLPERALRCSLGMASGAMRESAALLVPSAFQDSKTYEVLVRQLLDFLAEDVGRVERLDHAQQPPDPAMKNFVARKAVGNFIEAASLATVHLSPILVLAAVSDLAYGSRAYVQEVAVELQRRGVIAETSSIHNINDLLEAVGRASGTTATAFNTPPLSVAGLKKTIDDTRTAVAEIGPARLIPRSELEQLWKEIHQTAAAQGVDVFKLSGAMTLYAIGKMDTARHGALSTVTVAGRLFDRHIVEHYRQGLSDIQRRGIYTTLAETSQPYIAAVWQNFSSSQATITEDLLSGKLVGQAWHFARRWFGGSGAPPPPDQPKSDPAEEIR